jgi:rhamnulokinase
MRDGHTFLAVDLGAESGRVVQGTLADDRLTIEELARFPNGMVTIHGHQYWNLLRLYEQMLPAFRQAADAGNDIASIGVDSWGVDYVLLAEDGAPVGLPVAYRDSRTNGMMEKLFQQLDRETIYHKTGIQFAQFNTLFQLYAMSEQQAPQLKIARDFLMVPDYFHYLLTGMKTNEYTNASTTQLLSATDRQWDRELLQAAGISPTVFQKILLPGTVVGPLTDELKQLTGLAKTVVTAPATHDTASAVAAVPATGDNWAYISSGTWSLMGIEAQEPNTSAQAFACNFTNEGGVAGSIRFLKNIMGFWLVQQCRKEFNQEFSYAELTQLAAASSEFVSLIDPNVASFLNPPSMTVAIADFCHRTRQPAPESPGAIVRCCLESLALEYRLVYEQLRQIQQRPLEKIHIVGGGCQNELLCQFAANATGCMVLAGPVEATAIGNILLQAIGLGAISSLAEARAIVKRSFPVTVYAPEDTQLWDNAMDRFRQLKNNIT